MNTAVFRKLTCKHCCHRFVETFVYIFAEIFLLLMNQINNSSVLSFPFRRHIAILLTSDKSIYWLTGKNVSPFFSICFKKLHSRRNIIYEFYHSESSGDLPYPGKREPGRLCSSACPNVIILFLSLLTRSLFAPYQRIASFQEESVK